MDGLKDVCESPVTSESAEAVDQSSPASDSIQPDPSKLPKHQYTREQLLSWKDVRCSRLKPSCMSRDYESSEGVWDPEKWFNSTVGDAASSVTTSNSYNSQFAVEKMYSRGRKPEWDADEGGRRGAGKMLNDKGTSLKQNVGDSDVVLMPQRNFNSGCYVNNVDTQQRRDGRDQRFSQRCVGSGRIPVVDRLKGRVEDGSDGWNDRPSGSSRPRGKIVDRRFESSSRSDYKNSRDNRRAQPPEPLWFRDGPISQADTIELHGFNGPEKMDRPGTANEAKNNVTKLKDINEFDGYEENGKLDSAKERGRDSNTADQKQIYAANATGLCSFENVAGNSHEYRNALQGKSSDKGQASNEFDFESFMKSVGIPEIPASDADSGESRFQQFFSNQMGQECFPNGVAQDKNSPLVKTLPPPPPVYGHSIEQTIDADEEKKNFLHILQKAHKSYQHCQLHPTTNHPQVGGGGGGSRAHVSASLKELESDIKALLKVNGSATDAKHQNAPPGVFYGPAVNGGQTDRGLFSPPGLNKVVMTHNPLPVGCKITRVADLEGDAAKPPEISTNVVSRGGYHDKQNVEADDMSAYKKLLGLISQQGHQGHLSANQIHQENPSASFIQPPSHVVHGFSNPGAVDQMHHLSVTNVNSFIASINNDRSRAASPAVRSSPIAFGTCPPTNLATPMPIHAGHLINQFVANQGPKVHFNSLDTGMKFNNQNSAEHLLSKESPQCSAEKIQAFLPTSVIRQMAQDKEKKRGLKLDGSSFLGAQSELQMNPDVFASGSSKVPQQDTFWTILRSNGGENSGTNVPVFQPQLYNSQPSHSFPQHNQFPPQVPGMSLFSRPQHPQHPSVASFLQSLQQGRIVSQPQQQIIHPLLQQQATNTLPPKRAIVKGANNPSLPSLLINPEQQNMSLGNHVALQTSRVLSGSQVDQPTQAAVIAAIHQALSAKHQQQSSGLDGWHASNTSINGSSVSRMPNQVKLQ